MTTSHGASRLLALTSNNFRPQLVECLEASFPHVREWLGEQAFIYAAVKHINRHPPRAGIFDAYGRSFHLTLAELFPQNPALRELAWIESSLSAALLARDAVSMTAPELAGIDWHMARPQFAASLRTMRAVTNSAAIWQAMHNGRRRPQGEVLHQPCGLVVWSQGCVPCLHTIELLELEALVHMRTCGNFPALCTALIERLGEIEGVTRAAGFLANWVGSELITGVALAEP